MKAILSFLGMMAVASHGIRADEAQVRFVNGDRVTGSLLSFGPGELVWDSELFEDPATFATSKVASVMLPVSAPPKRKSSHEATVVMTNGDTLIGELVEVTKDFVLLDTWYAGRLKLNRVMVEKVNVDDAGILLYRGPNSRSGWTVSPDEDSWEYESFAFRSKGHGGIARDDLLVDECSVSFDLEWEADNLKFRTGLFTDRIDSLSPGSGYELAIQRTSISLRSLSSGTYLGNTSSRVISQSSEAHVEIRASRKTGKIALLINGELVDVWQDDAVKTSKFGSGLHFIADDQSSVRISAIRVTEWDGTIKEPLPDRRRIVRFGVNPMLPEESPMETPEEKEDEGRMKLANGDSIDGTVTAIREGKVELETALGKLTLPVERLRSVVLPPAPREAAFRDNADVRAILSDGSSMVFCLEHADAESVSGTSQNFGDIAIRRDAFQSIEFNIHYPEFMELQGTD